MLKDAQFGYTALIRVSLNTLKGAFDSIPDEKADEKAIEVEAQYKDSVSDYFEEYLSQNGATADIRDIEMSDLYDAEFSLSADITCGGTTDVYTPLDPYESPSCEDYPDVTELDIEDFIRDCCKRYNLSLLSADVSVKI